MSRAMIQVAAALLLVSPSLCAAAPSLEERAAALAAKKEAKAKRDAQEVSEIAAEEIALANDQKAQIALPKTQEEFLNAISRAGAAGADAAKQTDAKKKSEDNFFGLKLGVGLAATFDLGSNHRVESAKVVNGLVRVTKRTNTRARIMLESHYFFSGNDIPIVGRMFGRNTDWGIGPFVAVQPSSDKTIIDAIALGGMVGFKRGKDSLDSFNLGVGYIIDPNAQILGKGIVADSPLPIGETEVRFEEREQDGWMILVSFSF